MKKYIIEGHYECIPNGMATAYYEGSIYSDMYTCLCGEKGNRAYFLVNLGSEKDAYDLEQKETNKKLFAYHVKNFICASHPLSKEEMIRVIEEMEKK